MAETTFDFGGAIAILKQGGGVARHGWNGKGMWLELQRPDPHSKMSLPYIFMRTADTHLVPWLASQTDMLGEDWVRVDAPALHDAHHAKTSERHDPHNPSGTHC